jgi:NADPH:quinone reductase-like Zn-dependent oxidoreductase
MMVTVNTFYGRCSAMSASSPFRNHDNDASGESKHATPHLNPTFSAGPPSPIFASTVATSCCCEVQGWISFGVALHWMRPCHVDGAAVGTGQSASRLVWTHESSQGRCEQPGHRQHSSSGSRPLYYFGKSVFEKPGASNGRITLAGWGSQISSPPPSSTTTVSPKPTMRAVTRTGDPKVLSLDTNHPPPSAAEYPECYIIRTKATALTRAELTWPEPLLPDIPVPGFDLAGEIISVPTDPGEHSFKPGDEVYALTTFSWKGNARETSIGHENELALKPKNLSWEEAATVPLSALSAYEALFVHGKLNTPKKGTNPKKRVLVTAASGSVGVWGIQLAREAGLEIVGTCGTSNVEFVKSLGAQTVLDYTKTSLLDWVSEDLEARGFDVVFDCIGGQTLTDSWKCARRGGKVISVAEPPDPKKPTDGVADAVEGVWFIVKANGPALAEVTSLIEEGKCKPVVDSVYTLEQFKEAFDRLEGGHAKGKVVLTVG